MAARSGEAGRRIGVARSAGREIDYAFSAR